MSAFDEAVRPRNGISIVLARLGRPKRGFAGLVSALAGCACLSMLLPGSKAKFDSSCSHMESRVKSEDMEEECRGNSGESGRE